MRARVGAGIAAAEAAAICWQESARERYAWARSWGTRRSAGARWGDTEFFLRKHIPMARTVAVTHNGNADRIATWIGFVLEV